MEIDDVLGLKGYVSATPTSFKYKAFISYSHKDAAVVRELHRGLERYTIPKPLRRDQSHLRPIFRDREDLSVATHLSGAIEEALVQSEALIVVASPSAAQSRWVEQEIRYFKRLGRGEKIFIVILSGEPFVSDHPDPDVAASECLPETLRYITQAEKENGRQFAEPLAADFRAQGDGPKLGLKKLIAGLLGVELDALLQRDLVRVRRRMMGLMVSASVIIAALSTLSWVAYNAQQRAEARRADAENFVEFLLSDLAQQLESFGRLDLLDAMGEKAINYYEQFDDIDFDASASGRHARTLHFMGELQDKLGATEMAGDYFQKSYDMTAKGLMADPSNPERLFEHGRSALMKSLVFRRSAEFKAELESLNEYETLARRLTELSLETQNKARAESELATAKMNIGRVSMRLEDFENAKTQLREATELFKKVTKDAPSINAHLALSEALSWEAETYRKFGDKEQTFILRQRQADVIDKQRADFPDDFRTLEGSVYANLGFGNAARLNGKYEVSKTRLTAALQATKEALRREPEREKMVRAQSAVFMSLMKVSIEMQDWNGFTNWRESYQAMDAQIESQSVKENRFWSEIRPATLRLIDEEYNAALSAAHSSQLAPQK